MHRLNSISLTLVRLTKTEGQAITQDQLPSTLGRIIGRAVHCCVLHETLAQQWTAWSPILVLVSRNLYQAGHSFEWRNPWCGL
ncbi:hypothetical protein [Yersinia enterocolitica]|uniref:hypothetical protein n=1 Tax=Yersinia enterocolitica TaxID=630 RepID=UPI0021B4F505|nr:hypothetical protein [Yersinia enterocolitica]